MNNFTVSIDELYSLVKNDKQLSIRKKSENTTDYLSEKFSIVLTPAIINQIHERLRKGFFNNIKKRRQRSRSKERFEEGNSTWFKRNFKFVCFSSNMY